MTSKSRAQYRRSLREGKSSLNSFSPSKRALYLLGGCVVIAILFLWISNKNESSSSLPDEGEVIVATEFSFDPLISEISNEEGGVSITLLNKGAIYHDLKIEGIEDFHLTALPEESDSDQVMLGEGTYVFFCTIPGHRDAGMVGELVVQ